MRKIRIETEKMEYSGAEAYKSLRTNLMLCGSDKKVIAVTSCTPGEGKSSVTLNLAMSLAETGRRVVLIDADLRKSVLLGRVHVREAIQGLTHFLAGQEQLTDVICSTNVRGFYMVFAGPVPPNPAELLGGQRFSKMLEVLRETYDYVLIDTPPLGSVIDSAVIAQKCDGVVLVIEAGSISYRFAQSVKEQMEKTGCPILGTVLNKVNLHKQGYYGKYYGKYGEQQA